MIYELTPGSDLFDEDDNDTDVKTKMLRNAIFSISRPTAFKRQFDIYREMTLMRVRLLLNHVKSQSCLLTILHIVTLGLLYFEY